MIKPRTKGIIWLLWLLIVLPGTWFTFRFYPPLILELHIDLVAFFLLMFFVAITPMVINRRPIFLLYWVSLAIFLIFGLFVEMVFAQISIVFMLIRTRFQKEQHYKYPMYGIVFFFVSLLSGISYYLLGGTHNLDFLNNPKNLILAFTYGILYYSFKEIFLFGITAILTKVKRILFGRISLWEITSVLLTLPIGVILSILYDEIGLLSIIIVGIPYAILSGILNLYHASDRVNHYLQQATEIGHELAKSLHVEEVYDVFFHRIAQMLPVDYAFILEVVDDKELQLKRRVENRVEKSTNIHPLKKNEGISGHVWATGKSVLYHSKKEWKDIVKGYMPDVVESVICVPIVRNKEVNGILLLASKQKRLYDKSQLMIVDVLCSYFAVATENAKHFEIAKESSVRCALTNLYNYRYVENLLREEYMLLAKGQRQLLSVILIDIDYFKSVNDTYGHQSGNEILCGIAERLTKLTGKNGTVARYGGEEFLIVLPEVEKEAALKLAEAARQTIAERPFIVKQSIENIGRKTSVRVTASIGVATAPHDGEDSLSLVKYADRALYLGAKRIGRNRVAEYMS